MLTNFKFNVQKLKAGITPILSAFWDFKRYFNYFSGLEHLLHLDTLYFCGSSSISLIYTALKFWPCL